MDDKEFVLALYPTALCIMLLQHYHIGWEEVTDTGWKNVIWSGQGLTKQEAWKATAKDIQEQIFKKLQD